MQIYKSGFNRSDHVPDWFSTGPVSSRTGLSTGPVIPGSNFPDSRIHRARLPLTSWAFPELYMNLRTGFYPGMAGFPEIRGVRHFHRGSPGNISIPRIGRQPRLPESWHKSKYSYMSTPNSPALRGHPNRAPRWPDRVFPKWPTYPMDLLICATPAHIRTHTDRHVNSLYINL